MTSWVIVAIPSEQDPVWKYSSEKVPHLTMLFLGEQDGNENEQRMADFVEHVANTSLSRFGLSVDRRGVLGADEADVLFFDTRFIGQNLKEVRAQLLQDSDIAKAYHSTDQFEQWTPHLTMGYPETPAKEDDRDYPGFSYVNFDRIALWTGDSEGYEFPLKDAWDGPIDSVAMSASYEDILRHSGVKGMKWGVRKDEALMARMVGRKIAGETKEEHQVYKDYKKTTSKAQQKQDRQAVIQSKIEHVLKTSQQHPENFVKVGTPGYPTLMQGKEFISYLQKGGYFDPLATEVTDYGLKPEHR